MDNCNLTMEEQTERLAALEEAYNELPEDANTMEILEMIAEVTGESVTEIHERFVNIKENNQHQRN